MPEGTPRRSHPCVICAHPATTKCSACKKVYYCSREHQEMVLSLYLQVSEIMLMMALGVEETQKSMQNFPDEKST
jgi:hypothetical protein